jgi:hypothetical protein
MLKTDRQSILKAKNIIRRHYGIRGTQEITDIEVLQEIEALNRHHKEMSLDNFYGHLYAALHCIEE